jgi:hypothetical protein
MNKEFVTYELALELKQLGFDEPCLAYYLLPEIERTGDVLLHYCSRGKEIIRNNNWSWVYENFPTFRKYLKAEHCYTYSTNSSRLMVSAPTYSQAFRWFREKYDLVHYIDRNDDNMIEYAKSKGVIELLKYRCGYSDGTSHPIKGCHTYEEAELACLKKLIEIVKEINK